jgi:dTMP kinase
MSPGRGVFITLEGIEGVGKSTQLERIVGVIRDAGVPVDVTREPGGTPTAEVIRNILIEHGDEPMPASAEVLLMFAARALHVDNRIRPALEAGTWVVSDRFVDASRAYQGGGRGVPATTIETLADLSLRGLEPDVTLLLDAPVDVGLARAAKRGEKDRFEAEEQAFFERVRAAYLDLADANPERFVVIDASGDIERVGDAVERAARKALNHFRKAP